MLLNIWKQNPIRVLSVVGIAIQGVFGVLDSFGHPFTASQQAAITALIIGVLGEIARSQVTALASVPPVPPK